jgi:hypothetical protein
MNFSDKKRTIALAARIQPGDRALVYVTYPIKKFIWAIEYTGSLQEGTQTVAAFSGGTGGMLPEWNKVFRPIRFLATIDVNAAPDAQAVLQQAGVVFDPYPASMVPISATAYQKIFDAISWQWVASAQVMVTT